ncbi:MAG: hypothetical protein ACTHV2_09870, partial [Brachybacterium sp.]
GSVEHVEVFQMVSVRTSIIGRPRRLSRHRRAHPAFRIYPLSCEEPTISYGHRWSAEIDQLHGGVTIRWDGTTIHGLEVISHISGIEIDIDSTTHNIYEEFEAHQAIVDDHRTRTFAVSSATKSAFVREMSQTNYTVAQVEVGIVDRLSGSFQLHTFDTLRHALEFLSLIAPLDPEQVD